MSNLEHYFENLLYYGEDIKGEANKNALTEEQQKSVEQCAQYVIYSLFGTREHFDEWINREPASPWHRAEEPPKEVGCYLVVGFDRHWFYDIAEYFPTDNEWAMNENQSDSTYIRYWMPMPEPPKEEER